MIIRASVTIPLRQLEQLQPDVAERRVKIEIARQLANELADKLVLQSERDVVADVVEIWTDIEVEVRPRGTMAQATRPPIYPTTFPDRDMRAIEEAMAYSMGVDMGHRQDAAAYYMMGMTGRIKPPVDPEDADGYDAPDDATVVNIEFKDT